MLIIDRFEGDFVVIETSNGFINIPKADIPLSAREGDILDLSVNKNDTGARKKRINGMMDDLFKK